MSVEDLVDDRRPCNFCLAIQPVAKGFPILIIFIWSGKYLNNFQSIFYLERIWAIYRNFIFSSARVLDLKFVVIQRIDQNSVSGVIRGRHDFKFDRYPIGTKILSGLCPYPAVHKILKFERILKYYTWVSKYHSCWPLVVIVKIW